MLLNELKATPGARKSRKRLGRGDASGHGGTSTKGHKGQKARSGGGHKRSFEGGQTPLSRRLPKRGFTNIFRKELSVINLDQLTDWPTDVPVTEEALRSRGVVKKINQGVKLLGRGDCTAKLNVQLTSVSATAKQKIEAVGGQITVA